MGHYPDRGNTSVTAGKRSRQASVTRGQMPPPSHYPEVGSTSCRIHAWIYERIAICQTLETAYNPYRGRYTCAVNSGGDTRFARLPPVIEIIPRSGYNTHATCLKGLKSLKGILAARLPPVIEVIPHSGYFSHYGLNLLRNPVYRGILHIAYSLVTYQVLIQYPLEYTQIVANFFA